MVVTVDTARKMSNAAYADQQSSRDTLAGEGWTVLRGISGQSPNGFVETPNGFGAITFYRENKNASGAVTSVDVVTAFRGTETAMPLPIFQDLIVTDGAIALGNLPEQYVSAEGYVNDAGIRLSNLALEKAWPGPIKVKNTGHSLGGGLADYAAVLNGEEAITFNAAGATDAIRNRLGEQGLNNVDNSKITNYIEKNDFVSNALPQVGTNKYIDQVPNNDALNLLDQHLKILTQPIDETLVRVYPVSF